MSEPDETVVDADLDDDPYDIASDCSWCGGEGFMESDDPMWDQDDWVSCSACGGSGNAEDQTLW